MKIELHENRCDDEQTVEHKNKLNESQHLQQRNSSSLTFLSDLVSNCSSDEPVVDSNLKARILNLTLNAEESDVIDDDDTSTKPQLSQLSSHVQHAILSLRMDQLKLIAPRDSSKLKAIALQLKELENSKGFNMGKAQVEFAKRLKESPLPSVSSKEPKLGIADRLDSLIPQSLAQKKDDVAHGIVRGDEESEDNVDIGDFLNSAENEASTNFNSRASITQFSLIKNRAMGIPSSWTGKTPKMVLAEYCAKLAKGIKIKYKVIQDGRAIYRASVEIYGLPATSSPSSLCHWELERNDWVENSKIAEELVSVWSHR
jgi:hypothetical protein